MTKTKIKIEMLCIQVFATGMLTVPNKYKAIAIAKAMIAVAL